ncbi:MAG: PAS domain S-box protein [Methanomicrobiales archaeon]
MISILLVDDETDLLEIARLYLEEQRGFRVQSAVSAKEALRMMQETPFDVVVSDYQMPVMDGIQFLKKLRGKKDPTPFIVFTGKGREEIVIEALNEGADFYLQKGGEPKSQFAELSHIIRKVVRQHQAEDELGESEERYRRICVGLTDYMYTVQVRDGRAVSTTHGTACIAVTGYNAEEFAADPTLWIHMVFSEDRDRVISHFSMVLSGKTAPPVEHRIVRKDGRVRWVRNTPVLQVDPVTGNLISYDGMITDITELKQAEEALQKNSEELYASYEQLTASEEELGANLDEMTRQGMALRESKRELTNIIEFLPDATLVIDREGTVIAWNLAMVEMTGVPAEQMIGKGNYEYALPFYHERRPITIDLVLHDDPDVVAKYPVMQKEGRSLRSEIFIPHLNRGRGAHLWFKASPLYDTAGKLMGAIESIRDITDRRQAQEALRVLGAYNRSLIEAGLDPLVTINSDGKIADVNTSTEKVTGYSREELIGTDFSDYFTEPDKAREGYRKVFDDGAVRDYPLEIRHRNGTITSVLYNATIYRDETGTALGIFAAARDITDRKQAEESLRVANKKLNLLSSITRHDINNQLTVQMGYLALLEKQQPDLLSTEYFLKVATAARRISSMIQFTKEYENIGVTAPFWQDTRSLVDVALKDALPGQVTVKNDLPAGVEVFADHLITRVFYNLMDNAVRYGGKITVIRFTMEDSGNDHILVCEDDGVGVAADEKEKIFYRGFGKNTGLGLFLGREILSITGIKICETGEPGKGARFEMTVPKGMWRTAETGNAGN